MTGRPAAHRFARNVSAFNDNDGSTTAKKPRRIRRFAVPMQWRLCMVFFIFFFFLRRLRFEYICIVRQLTVSAAAAVGGGKSGVSKTIETEKRSPGVGRFERGKSNKEFIRRSFFFFFVLFFLFYFYPRSNRSCSFYRFCLTDRIHDSMYYYAPTEAIIFVLLLFKSHGWDDVVTTAYRVVYVLLP